MEYPGTGIGRRGVGLGVGIYVVPSSAKARDTPWEREHLTRPRGCLHQTAWTVDARTLVHKYVVPGASAPVRAGYPLVGVSRSQDAVTHHNSSLRPGSPISDRQRERDGTLRATLRVMRRGAPPRRQDRSRSLEDCPTYG